ncbi:sensor histidine kinase [Sphingosinicella sp. CPCC 101087]|uniref:sensor histidine kinase n=1 Tax=Sphingosinicella sp. CPCC 101087 TaxID=2497754 RepID=UPI0013EE2755|nr:ATP-binding protein [Sphingosinicella sp. CPCC 101087]
MSARLDEDEQALRPGTDEVPAAADSLIVREQAATIAHYRKMYERSSMLARLGVWECDLVTGKLTWTDGVYDLFELPRGSPVRRSDILQMYHDESREEMERLRAEAIAGGGSFSLDIRIRTARGNDRWLRLTADVEQEGGRPVRIFGIKQDVTEARAAQERVKALQAELIQMARKSAMGTMAATLAHELNQPLAAISNYVAGSRHALDAEPARKEVLARGLDAIEESALRAGGVIRSLRRLAEGSPAVRQPVDSKRLIEDAAAVALAAREGVALELRLVDRLILSVDPVQFHHVVHNLIRNSAEAFAGGPGRIVVATAAIDGFAEIRVEDDGPGIPRERLPTLFETFTSTKADGMGVGLAICRTVVEAHGGRITAGIRRDGGAVFRVVLPLAARLGPRADRD